jgi:hypothetical protein
MSLELLGAQCVGYVEPTRSWVATPASVKAELTDVLQEGKSLNDDIKSFRSADPEFASFVKAWDGFWSGYLAFHEDTASGISGWVSRLWGAAADRTRDYGNKLNDWRAKFKSLGGHPTEPDVIPKARRDEPNAIQWNKVAFGVLVVGGIAAGGYAVSKLTSFGSVFKRHSSSDKQLP